MAQVLVNGSPVDYDAGNLLPEHMRDGMKLYIEHRIPPGSFLMAVLENDMMGALSRADHINQNRLHDYAVWLSNCAPSECYGSPEIVKAWLDGEK